MRTAKSVQALGVRRGAALRNCGTVEGGGHALLALPIVQNLSGQPKVCDLEVHLLIDKNVTKLQVAVDDVLAVHVDHAVQQLHHVELRLRLRQPLALLHKVHQRLRVRRKALARGAGGRTAEVQQQRGGRSGTHPSGAEIHHHVDVVAILEPIKEVEDVGVGVLLRDGLVDLDLGVQLLQQRGRIRLSRRAGRSGRAAAWRRTFCLDLESRMLARYTTLTAFSLPLETQVHW